MRIQTKYIADDGTAFDSEAACRVHEATLPIVVQAEAAFADKYPEDIAVSDVVRWVMANYNVKEKS